ncbi:MAG: capsular biosynthesis protein [Cyclobacteriaceae bacterium]|jgi:protein-tyrosine phosphatase|nr:capsular biosynthesis protein [Cytophagales bacterium]MCZ8329391.1 capsular biosynthesis protein [Cyclobacteriaceae bacterium]
MAMWHWFKRKTENTYIPPLLTDIHSHLLPGLDDGVRTTTESIELIKCFQDLGYTRLITSPHVHELYRNTAKNITQQHQKLTDALVQAGITLEVIATAEYNLDDWFISQFNTNETLLPFGGNYLLIETNFFAEPLILNEIIFKIKSRKYNPVLAHPERYLYLQKNMARIEDLQQRGILFQLNSVSLAGAYGPAAERTARELIDRGMVHILGSDCHNKAQFDLLIKARKTRYYEKALALPLLNYSI